MLNKAYLDNSTQVENQKMGIKDFDNFSLTMLGDILKHQFLGQEKRICYPGSLIQQNFGEDLKHGYVIWNLETLKGKFVVVEVFYSFHKERLECQKNSEIVSSILREVFGKKLGLKCELSEKKPVKKYSKESGDLTDYNVVVPMNKSPVEIFDGGLPLN